MSLEVVQNWLRVLSYSAIVRVYFIFLNGLVSDLRPRNSDAFSLL
jgi:hypothetical protein